jgi:hypothetical protein
MAITTIWLVYHSALIRQALVIQAIKKAAPAATYLTHVCRLQSRGAICSWRICRTTNVLWSAQVISTLLISGLRSRIQGVCRHLARDVAILDERLPGICSIRERPSSAYAGTDAVANARPVTIKRFI